MQLLAVMCRQGKALSELKTIFEPVPQTLVNVVVKERREIEAIRGVMKAIRSVEGKLGKDGRVLVRFSGTEAKARVLVEGPNRSRNETFAQEIADALLRALPA